MGMMTRRRPPPCTSAILWTPTIGPCPGNMSTSSYKPPRAARADQKTDRRREKTEMESKRVLCAMVSEEGNWRCPFGRRGANNAYENSPIARFPPPPPQFGRIIYFGRPRQDACREPFGKLIHFGRLGRDVSRKPFGSSIDSGQPVEVISRGAQNDALAGGGKGEYLYDVRCMELQMWYHSMHAETHIHSGEGWS